ncbi:MAG: cyclic di-GMP phosphodiesterase [Thermoleophilaceae bacterium]|jgi:putative two-component system response regulator|nr:cyclic di-GMP phosphodiesterase [Thermoleophilaceae bacterium]
MTLVTALVVDADPKTRLFTVGLLERHGMAATGVSNLATARAELSVQLFDLVVSDLLLGDEMGAASATILVRSERTDEIAADALAARFDDHLQKPFSAEELAIAVTRALRRRAERVGSPEHPDARLAEGVLECLIRAGRFRDEETSEHVERVSRTCALIARSLGWPASDCWTLRVASAMHDIGKVGVPDVVLRKPGKLSASERAVIQRHAPIGRDILGGSGDPVLEMASTIAGSHHERVDGEGYPDGLAGEEIPLAARITAVADVFDALTHDRVYRDALTVEAALETMQAGEGSQFDGRMLAAFRAVLPQVVQIGELYPDSEQAEPGLEVGEAPQQPLRVLIIEDHGAVARGLALLLRREGMEVAGTAETLTEAERLVEQRGADVAILDADLHGESSLGLIPKARARGVRVLLYTGGTPAVPVSSADKPDGIASKSGGPGELIKAVREVAAGRSPTDNRVVERAPVGLLSPRECEIVGLLSQGVTGEDIAGRLFVSPHTVRTHVRNAMTKTNAHTRAHLVTLVAESGQITRMSG